MVSSRLPQARKRALYGRVSACDHLETVLSNTTPSLPRVGLTLGDPAGIGPEVMIAALAGTWATRRARIHLFLTPALVDLTRDLLDQAGLTEAVDAGQSGVQFERVSLPPASDRAPEPGVATEEGRTQAFSTLAAMADRALEGRLEAMVTGPVTKSIFDHLSPRPQGQTEFLAGRLDAARFAMMLAGPRLRVVPVTTHVPLWQVPELLTQEVIVGASRAVVGDLQRWFGIERPRLAVCGLNPHAGEGGRTGDEEATIIAPAVTKLRAAGIAAEGPLPSDALFYQALQGRWDAVICMFHDQALGPLKTAHFGDAFNMTCGLPVPRLSPDHGTAFALAGRGAADSGSAVAAMERALQIAELRIKTSAGGEHAYV